MTQEQKIKEFIEKWQSCITTADHCVIDNAFRTDLTNLLDNWISVKMELPKNDSSVLVWDSDVNEMSFGYCIYKKWYFNRDGSLDTGITHWQPLLQPPKED